MSCLPKKQVGRWDGGHIVGNDLEFLGEFDGAGSDGWRGL